MSNKKKKVLVVKINEDREFKCKFCPKVYKHRQSEFKHRKNCNFNPNNMVMQNLIKKINSLEKKISESINNPQEIKLLIITNTNNHE